MSNYKEYPNKGPSSRKNGHVTLTSSKLIDTSELIADSIVRRLRDVEPCGLGIWTATCPVCGVPERTLTVVVLSETREVGIKCFGPGCPRADILTALGIDPDASGLHKPKAQPWRTHLELLSELAQ